MQVGGGIVTLLVGLGFLLFVYGSAQAARQRRSSGTTTQGVVVGSETRRNTAGMGAQSFYEHPVVEFRDQAGAVRRFVHATGTRSKPAAGRAVRVWYDPDRPDAAPAIAGDPVNLVLVVVFTVAGCIATAVGFGLLGAAIGIW